MTELACDAGRAVAAVVVSAENDRFASPLQISSWRFDCKLSGKDTAGNLCIYDTTRTGRGGPPLHVHFAQDEWFFVREGEYIFKVGDGIFHLKAGDSLLAPRNVPHAFSSLSARSVLIVAFQPTGTIDPSGFLPVASPQAPDRWTWRALAPAIPVLLALATLTPCAVVAYGLPAVARALAGSLAVQISDHEHSRSALVRSLGLMLPGP
jgi:mannose-6-phosphate isomerase-like protein (cupin superfamily)